MQKELTIQLDVKGKTLTVKALVEALEKALALLRTLDPNGEWEVVRMTKNSPVRIVLRNPNAASTAPKYMRNIRGMNRKLGAKRISRLSGPMVVATRDFTNVLNDGFSAIKMSFPGQPVAEFTPRVVENIGQAARVATQWMYEWTSIRGLLYQITWSDGITRCRIREALHETEIACIVSPELLATVKEALPHRVDLYGRAKSNRIDGVVSIDVEKIEILPDESPSIKDMPAIDITDGVDSVEYIARLRGGE